MAGTRIDDVAIHPGAGGLFKAALVAGAVFLLWKAARGLRGLAWAAFGLGMAAYWTGFRPF
jgi:hypothetical protein